LAVTPGGFTKQILGNKALKPAHSTELELGGNLEFGASRFNLEYTYAKKETKDQILLVDLAAVAGFKQQWQNTGALESSTHEIALAAGCQQPVHLVDRQHRGRSDPAGHHGMEPAPAPVQLPADAQRVLPGPGVQPGCDLRESLDPELRRAA
jgi:hypothetical protein